MRCRSDGARINFGAAGYKDGAPTSFEYWNWICFVLAQWRGDEADAMGECGISVFADEFSSVIEAEDTGRSERAYLVGLDGGK